MAASLPGSTPQALTMTLTDGSASTLDIFNLKSLPAELKDWVWDLFERNMQTYYEDSADGWIPDDKRTEIMHAQSRFLVLRELSRSGREPGQNLGYAVVRFDTEDTARADGEQCDVLYCYEVQVDPHAQRRGVGQALMRACMLMAKEWRMDKVMLTVFKNNEPAQRFYEKQGYETDEIDPSHFAGAESEESVDYRIMSKACS